MKFNPHNRSLRLAAHFDKWLIYMILLMFIVLAQTVEIP